MLSILRGGWNIWQWVIAGQLTGSEWSWQFRATPLRTGMSGHASTLEVEGCDRAERMPRSNAIRSGTKNRVRPVSRQRGSGGATRRFAGGTGIARPRVLNPKSLELLLDEMRLREIDYRALERRSNTPQPPSRRWTVYRFDFVNGQQYVGITQRSASAREAEHISEDRRLTGGSARISKLVAAGVAYELVILATDLTEGEAYEREREEIAKLEDPLNVVGPIKTRHA